LQLRIARNVEIREEMRNLHIREA